MHNSLGSVVLWSTGLLLALSAASAAVMAIDGVSPPAARQWDVPLRMDSDSVGLWAADDGKRVFLSEDFSLEGPDGGRERHFRLYVLEMTTGKCTDIAKALVKATNVKELTYPSVLPSPDGRHVVVMVSGEGATRTRTAWLFTVASGKARMNTGSERHLSLVGGARVMFRVNPGRLPGGFGDGVIGETALRFAARTRRTLLGREGMDEQDRAS